MLIDVAPLAIGATLVLLLPGLIWAWWRFPSPQPATRIAVGLALGFAVQVHASALLAWGPRITRTSVLLATVAGILLAVLVIWRTSPISQAPHFLAKGATRHGIHLVALLAIITIPRLLPLVFETIPDGWDPSFHSLLASTTLTSGRLPTWSPFEQIPSNYPYGPHVFIAEISLITGVAPDKVFAVLLNAVLPAITCLALYPLARRVLRSHAYALGAVAAYGLLGNWGSIDYFQWGGLPNELGFFLVLVFLIVLFMPGFTWTSMIVGGILLGAIPITHNHVMLTTVILLVAYAGILLVRLAMPRPKPISRRQVTGILRRLLLTAIIAVITASYYVVPILLRVGDLGSTRATQYLDEYSGAIFEKNGWLLWGLALVGAAMMYLGLARYRRESPVLRARFATGGISGAARGFVICASATLLLAFLFGYYVYRRYSFLFSSSHQPYTLFTPTRFLTDLTYFLPFFAALPLATAWQWTVSHIPRFAVPPATASLLSRVLVRMLITCVVLGTTVFLLDIPAMQTHGRLAPGEAAAFAWIRANTPASTLVINLNTNANWTPYFTQREVSYTPVPVSEFVDGYVNEKRFLSDRVLDAMTQPGSSRVIAFAGIGTAITSLASRPVAIVTDHALLNLSVAPAFVADPQRVYLLGDAFTSLNINHPSTGTAALAWWSASSSPADDWTTSIPSPDGWTSVPPLASTARAAMYLRLVLLGSSASGLRIRCEAHGSVAIYEDGVQIPHGCVGGWKALPSFVTPGPHVLAFRVGFDSAADPWFAVMLMKPADASCGC